MKFLLITNLYEPYARGGAEEVVKTVAEGLAKRGHEVVVLTTGPMRYGLWPTMERPGQVRVLRFSPWNIYFVRNDFRFPKPIRALARLIEIFSPHPGLVVKGVIRKEKPDAVITHNLVGMGMRIAAAIKKTGVRHIHTLHDIQLVHPSGILLFGEEARAESSALRKWYEGMTRKLWGSPDVVVAPSKWLLDFHTSRGFFPNSKTAVLPNPVESPPPLTPRLCSGQVGGGRGRVVDGKIRLLYAGQLEPHKGVRWLLSQNREQRTENRVVFEFAGAGLLSSEVKKAAAGDPEHLVFHGKLSQNDLQKRFAKVDALVVPSFCYENTPRVISEALGAGLPVIASRIGGIPEMIRDGEDGFLFAPGDADDFARAISKLREKKMTPKPAAGSLSQYLDDLLGLM